jgi:hypothetical protein
MHGQKKDIREFITTHSLAPLAHALPTPHPNVPPHVFGFGLDICRDDLYRTVLVDTVDFSCA